jgi:hypothetical protein
MRMWKTIASAPAAFTLMSLAAQAQVLSVVEVGAPAVNCVFNPSCTITVSDTLGFIPLPYLTAPRRRGCSRERSPALPARRARARPATCIASA